MTGRWWPGRVQRATTALLLSLHPGVDGDRVLQPGAGVVLRRAGYDDPALRRRLLVRAREPRTAAGLHVPLDPRGRHRVVQRGRHRTHCRPLPAEGERGRLSNGAE